MNKSAIRNFSIYARRKLIEDACYQASLIGITDRMIAEPRIDGAAERYDIGGGQFHTIHEPEIAQRRALANEIRRRARDIGHAAAYRYIAERSQKRRYPPSHSFSRRTGLSVTWCRTVWGAYGRRDARRVICGRNGNTIWTKRRRKRK